MGMSMWDMLASHSSWKINVLCMMAWARAKLLQPESIKWNYEIIRWTVKLINMMTYFIKPKILSSFRCYNANIPHVKLTNKYHPYSSMVRQSQSYVLIFRSPASISLDVGLLPNHICFHFSILYIASSHPWFTANLQWWRGRKKLSSEKEKVL